MKKDIDFSDLNNSSKFHQKELYYDFSSGKFVETKKAIMRPEAEMSEVHCNRPVPIVDKRLKEKSNNPFIRLIHKLFRK